MAYDQLANLQALIEQRKTWTDEAILDELRALSVLPDEDDPLWNEDATWRDHFDVYDALSKIAAERKLRPAVLLLLERSSYGDPYEIMRGLRHTLEGIVNPDWQVLADLCMQAANYPQNGARLWAVRELGVLRDRRSLGALLGALSDSAKLVRLEACSSLYMLCQENEDCRYMAKLGLTKFIEQHAGDDEAREAADDLAGIESLEQDEEG